MIEFFNQDEKGHRLGRQTLIIGMILAALFIGGFLGQVFLGNEQSVTQDSGRHSGIGETVLAGLTRAASPEANWVRKSEAEMHSLAARLEQLERENQKIKQELEQAPQQPVADDSPQNYSYGPDSGEVVDEFDMEESFVDPFATLPAPVTLAPLPVVEGGDIYGPAPPAPLAPPPVAPLVVTFNLDQRGDPAVKSTQNYLPAGAYAPAVVIAGADASVGLHNQSDPRPVLLRITGVARSAALEGVVQEIDLKGCTVTAEARGDLSSEKVYVRPQTLTCAKGPEEIIETQIYAYVAGSGKAGVRGRVVSREGDLIDKALVAGLVQGVGQGASKVFQPQDLALAGGQVVGQTDLTNRIQNLGISALGDGLSSAANTVSQYLIDRAEQYQPVISLQSNTAVEIVFLKGVWLDGTGPTTSTQTATAQAGEIQ